METGRVFQGEHGEDSRVRQVYRAIQNGRFRRRYGQQVQRAADGAAGERPAKIVRRSTSSAAISHRGSVLQEGRSLPAI